MKLSAEELAKAIGDSVNGSDFDEEVFVETMMREHRTIQQNAMRVWTKLVERYAELPETHYDMRNEGTVLMCRSIRDKVFVENGAFLPHV